VCEEQILETGWYVRKVKEAKGHEAVLAVLSQLWGSREEGRVLLEECGGIPAGVVKYTEEVRSWYPQLAKQMELPLVPGFVPQAGSPPPSLIATTSYVQ
jgi:hypothetical protein